MSSVMCCRKDRESRLHKLVQVHQHFSGTLASGAMPYYPFCQTSSGHGLVGTRYQCTNSAVEVDYGNGSAGLDAIVISSYSSTLVFTDHLSSLVGCYGTYFFPLSVWLHSSLKSRDFTAITSLTLFAECCGCDNHS